MGEMLVGASRRVAGRCALPTLPRLAVTGPIGTEHFRLAIEWAEQWALALDKI